MSCCGDRLTSFSAMRQHPMGYLIWDLFPEYFRGRWAVLHQLARELDRPEIEPPPMKWCKSRPDRELEGRRGRVYRITSSHRKPSNLWSVPK